MGLDLETRGELENFIRSVLDRLGIRPATERLSAFKVATLPAASADLEGAVVYVKDAAAGSKFQGCDGAGWVSLG